MASLLDLATALPASEGESNNPLLEPSPGLMIWTLVIFGIVFFILKKYVFGPVAEVVEKRRDQIAESIDEAERSRDEATRLLDDYKVRLAEARREADQLREQGRKEGERQGAELVESAQAQRDRVLTDAETQIDAQARQAAAGIRNDVVDLALLAAEKVTSKSLSDDDHRRLIEEAIDGADLSTLATGAEGGS
ncbi:MAG: F0F1 ATP synthase subunit B [Miltoncostaeaceae bacterium]